MNLLDTLDPKMQAALIGAIVSTILTILTFLLKDYLIPIIHEKRISRAENINALKTYSYPLIVSLESLCWRFREIFLNRGGYLLEHSPKNKFNSYKFDSTIYRLCSVLGWVRAIKKEFSLTNIDDKSKYSEISKALIELEKSLADGEHMEISMLKSLCKLWKFEQFDNLDKFEQSKLAIECENIVYEFLDKEKKSLIAKELSESLQFELVLALSKTIAIKLNVKEPEQRIIKELQNSAIAETSRIEQWIYRDWQSAIGDMMLNEHENSSKRFSVIGYRDFEKILLDESNPDSIWICRVGDLFNGLNVNVADRFDARLQQLKNLYKSSVNLIEQLRKVKTGNKTISDKSFQELKKFCESL